MNFPTGIVRWGILGCGDVTEVKSGPALQKADRSTISAVMRRDGAKAEDYARRHGVQRWYDDANALIADDTVDAVYVATPPDSHEDLTMRVLAARKPVFCEKPLALSVAECVRMDNAAKAADVPLIVAYYRRALPRFERMREIVQNGTIGTPRAVLANQWKRATDLPQEAWKLDPAVSGGGHFADMYSHALDWLDHVFGPARSVSGFTDSQSDAYGAEDLVTFTIDQNGVPVSGLCSYAADRDEDRLTVIGDKGRVSMAFFAASPVRVESLGGTLEENHPDPPHVHQPLIERIIACLLDGAPNPCDAATATRAVHTVETIYAKA